MCSSLVWFALISSVYSCLDHGRSVAGTSDEYHPGKVARRGEGWCRRPAQAPPPTLTRPEPHTTEALSDAVGRPRGAADDALTPGLEGAQALLLSQAAGLGALLRQAVCDLLLSHALDELGIAILLLEQLV